MTVDMPRFWPDTAACRLSTPKRHIALFAPMGQRVSGLLGIISTQCRKKEQHAIDGLVRYSLVFPTSNSAVLAHSMLLCLSIHNRWLPLTHGLWPLFSVAPFCNWQARYWLAPQSNSLNIHCSSHLLHHFATASLLPGQGQPPVSSLPTRYVIMKVSAVSLLLKPVQQPTANLECPQALRLPHQGLAWDQAGVGRDRAARNST